jgi:cAMP-specific phosphodiesterase 4/high affinity cAMP-specific and IBMX-insensitive 3',5'-cyclic phosphodiesterase 8
LDAIVGLRDIEDAVRIDVAEVDKDEDLLGTSNTTNNTRTLELLNNAMRSWEFDAWELDRVTGGRVLSALAFHLINDETNLIARCRVDSGKMLRFMRAVEDGYIGTNPYHNRRHAADVVQTAHMLLTRGYMAVHEIDALTQLAFYLAAAVHDFQHPGRTNDFLVRTSSDLALRYNDSAPLENHHLSSIFTMLKARPDIDFLADMGRQDVVTLRRTIIDLVLATESTCRAHAMVYAQIACT